MAPPHASAAPETLALTPATTRLGLTVYALGIFPLPATYPALNGTLIIDPDRPGFCHVMLTVQQSSLHMADPRRVSKALAPDMLDAARYPTMQFDGGCQGHTLIGHLTLHGITRPLIFKLSHNGDNVKGESELHRRDYAINGMPHLVGQLIGIHFSTTLPMLAFAGDKRASHCPRLP